MKKLSYHEVGAKVFEAICAALAAPGPKSNTYLIDAINRAMYENGWTPEEYEQCYRDEIERYYDDIES